MDFKRLLDNITLYSDYSFFNSLLINYQYPDFLDLGTKQKYLKNGFVVVDPDKVIRILSPNNDVYVRINKDDELIIMTENARNVLKAKYNIEVIKLNSICYKQGKNLKNENH